MQTTHQTALQNKHEMLDRQIADEIHRPMPDTQAVADLKKRKLRVKEQLAAL